MSLVPKVTVATIDNLLGKTIKIQDTTGVYNAGTNPGGYGAPNYATTDLDWALLRFRHYSDTDYTTKQYDSLVDLLGTGQSIDGLLDGVFKDGVWELKYYPVIAHPITPNVITGITWTVGSRTFALASADTILAGASAILLWNLSKTKLYFLDPTIPATNSVATVTETLPSSGSGNLGITYEADTRFLVTAAADNCLAIDTGKIIRECSCFSAEMSALFLRMGKRQGADIHYTKGNYQATHDIITQLAAYCDNTLNCGCK